MTDRNYFEHDGKPDPKDQVEILKVLSLLITFSGGTASLFINAIKSGDLGIGWAIYAVPLIGGLVLTLWSLRLSYLVIRGRDPLLTTKAPQIIALGLPIIAVSWVVGIVFALLF